MGGVSSVSLVRCVAVDSKQRAVHDIKLERIMRSVAMCNGCLTCSGVIDCSAWSQKNESLSIVEPSWMPRLICTTRGLRMIEQMIEWQGSKAQRTKSEKLENWFVEHTDAARLAVLVIK